MRFFGCCYIRGVGAALILFSLLVFASCDGIVSPELSTDKVTEYVYVTSPTDDEGWGNVDVSDYRIPVSITGSVRSRVFTASISGAGAAGLLDIHYEWSANGVPIPGSDKAEIEYIPDEVGDKVIDCICTASYKGQTVTGQSNILELHYTADDIAHLYD